MEKIKKVARKYGDFIFQLAVNDVIRVGFENYKNADIEEICQTLSDKSSAKGVLTPELTKHIVRCAHEIASTSDSFTLMKYIKTYALEMAVKKYFCSSHQQLPCEETGTITDVIGKNSNIIRKEHTV